eukprot:scaffold28826_cov253-Isochrysis_galbana.AAC.1
MASPASWSGKTGGLPFTTCTPPACIPTRTHPCTHPRLCQAYGEACVALGQHDDALKIFLRMVTTRSEDKHVRKMLATSIGSPGKKKTNGHSGPRGKSTSSSCPPTTHQSPSSTASIIRAAALAQSGVGTFAAALSLRKRLPPPCRRRGAASVAAAIRRQVGLGARLSGHHGQGLLAPGGGVRALRRGGALGPDLDLIRAQLRAHARGQRQVSARRARGRETRALASYSLATPQ